MFKKALLPLLILAVFLLNILIYIRAYLTIESADLIFAECARNSGRTAAALNLTLLFMLGYLGLKNSYNTVNKKSAFLILTTLFAINHIIHFYFVSQNFKSQSVELAISHNLHGFITFICIIILPILLWRYKKLTRFLYVAIILHFFNVTYFMIDTFYSRVKPEDNAYLHQIEILIMTGACGYIFYRIYREKQLKS